MRGFGEFSLGDFQGGVVACLQLGDALALMSKPSTGRCLAEFHGQGQADVAEADDGEGHWGGALLDA